LAHLVMLASPDLPAVDNNLRDEIATHERRQVARECEPPVSAPACDVPCLDPKDGHFDSCHPLYSRPVGTGLPRGLGAIGVQMQCAINRGMPRRRHPKLVAEHVHAS
jgi:hypothetical protein